MPVADKQGSIISKDRIDAFWKLSFAAAFGLIFAWLAFKADYVGTHHDESYSCFYFSKDIHTARTNYRSTNNHVLNSVLMCFGRKLFGGYVHYIRVFPVLSALLFFLSVAYVVKKVIKSLPLQTASLILIFTVRSMFDYLYTARGYTYGLSATMLYIAVIFFLLGRPVRFRYWWVVAVLLSAINFYSLGAMISAVLCMVSLNAVFILFYSGDVYKDRGKRIISIIMHACLILALSGAMLYFFYRPILKDILHVEQNPYVKDIAAGWMGWSSFVPFVHELLIDLVFDMRGGGRFWLYVFSAAATAGLAVICARAVRALRFKNAAAFIDSERFGLFLLLFFVVYFFALFCYCVILGKSPGLLRNQIFLLPVFLLVCLWCIDRLYSRFSMGFWTAVQIMILGVVLGTGFHKMPYLLTLDKGVGIARPTLERLKKLDPQATWAICFSDKMNIYTLNFQYYTQFDYKFHIAAPQDCNVFICRPEECPRGATCLDYDYYMKRDNCIVAFVKPLNMEKVILEAKPKKKP